MCKRLLILSLFWSCGALLTVLPGCSRRAVVISDRELAEVDRAVPAGSTGPAEPSRAREEKPAPDGVRSSFPEDRGGALLRKVLSPQGGPPHRPEPSGCDSTPPDPALPADLDTLTLPLPVHVLPLPNLPAPGKAHPLRPQFVSAEPFEPMSGNVALPEAPSFAVGPRVRVPSVDVNEPLPLPPLARQVPDRASLEDVTGEASAQAALAARIPRRTTPAPFLRLSLPDPYEHRRPVTVPVPAEETTPAAFSLKTPKTPPAPKP
jgi:hypothetical protein